jgi:hypothetical protein
MKKLIDGKLYDTESAERVALWRNVLDRTNFRYCREELYLSSGGRWFIYGTGGPKSKYSERTAGGRSGGEDIRAVSEDEAFQWCQKKDQVGAAQNHFPDRIEPA